MRLKELQEEFLGGEMIEVLRCEHCRHEQERIQMEGNKPPEDVVCKKCGMTTDKE
jgi:hypothetical protein